MARIINGVAVADDYEHIVGPIEGYERVTEVEAEDHSRRPAPKAGRHATADTKVVTEVDA